MAKTTETAVPNARLSIPLTADGLIDMEHMRPSTAQKLIDLIKTDPTIRDTYAEINGATDEPDGLFEGLTAENVSKGLDAICTVNAMLFRIGAARFIKHPLLKDATTGKPLPLVLDPDILDKSFGLTDKQHAELDPRAAKVAQKYGNKMPEWLKKHLDLYMLGTMFIAYTGENARTVLTAQIARDVARAREQFLQQAAARPKNPQPDSDVIKQAQPLNGRDRAPEPFPPTDTTAPPEAPTV
jgi:hypothetical protein